MPSRRQEEWRFTGLKAIEDSIFEAPALSPPRFDVGPWRVQGSHLLVFIDGIFAPEISDKAGLRDGVLVANLGLASTSGSDVLSRHLGSLAPVDRHPFAALNTAVLRDGTVIEVPNPPATWTPKPAGRSWTCSRTSTARVKP